MGDCMRKMLNTLYVITPQAYLARESENVLVKVEEETKIRIPIHNLEGIVTFGYTGASPALMKLCADRGVTLTFLTESGNFLGRFIGPVSGNVLLRRKQYRMADNEDESVRLAKCFLAGKLVNSRTVLQRAVRDHEADIDASLVKTAVIYLLRSIESLEKCKSLDSLRGVEGDGAQTYFSVFDDLILSNKSDFYFLGRNKRPPIDNVNALLSFLYTLLTHDVNAALESVGLDPAVGFLHRDRPGRPSLALDMMEELRPFLADRLALSLINRKQIKGKGFVKKESGGVLMDYDTRKEVITAWQKRKQDEITHPFLEEKIPIGLLPYAQALLLARSIRGDLDAYPPFLWR